MSKQIKNPLVGRAGLSQSYDTRIVSVRVKVKRRSGGEDVVARSPQILRDLAEEWERQENEA